MWEYKNSLRIYAVMEIIKTMWLGSLLSIIYFKFVWLDDFWISFFHIIVAILLFFLEIPTWIFADKFWYKKSINLSYLFLWLFFFSYVASSFWGSWIVFVFSSSLFALSWAFNSWATSSYIYSIFKIQNKTENYLKYTAKVWWIWKIFKAIWALLSSFLYNISEIFPYSLQWCLILLMFILSLHLKPIPVGYREKKQTFLDYTKKSMKYFFNSKIILFLFTFFFFSTIWFQFFNHMLNQSYWLEKWLSITDIWLLWISLFVIDGILSFSVPYLWKILWKQGIFIFLWLMSIIIPIWLFFSNNIIFIIVFSGLFYWLFWTAWKIMDYCLQEAISQDKIRATILSTWNMFLTFFEKILFLWVWFLAINNSYSQIILMIGLFSWLISIILSVFHILFLKQTEDASSLV